MKNKHKQLIEQLTDREIIFHLALTQVLLMTVSFLLGIWLFDSWTEFTNIFQWNDRRIITYGGSAGLGVVLLDFIFMKFFPKHYFDDGGLNERLFKNKTVWQIAIIAFVVAITEEILFRGVIQTHFGLVISSIIFAIVHYRYLFNLFLFINVVTLSFFIGYLYFLTGNILVTIVMHFIIDFLLGLMIRYKNIR